MIGRIAPFFRNGWPRMKKDARVMALPHAASLLVAPVACLPALLSRESLYVNAWLWICAVQFATFNLMCAALFGDEYANNTMERLLSQPLARRTIWNEKMLVAALMLGICLVWDKMLHLTIFRHLPVLNWSEGFGPPVVLAVSAFTTAPLLSIKSKTTIAGMLAAMLLPYVALGVFIVIILVLDNPPVPEDRLALAFALAGWCGSYWLGRRTFLRLEV